METEYLLFFYSGLPGRDGLVMTGVPDGVLAPVVPVLVTNTFGVVKDTMDLNTDEGEIIVMDI